MTQMNKTVPRMRMRAGPFKVRLAATFIERSIGSLFNEPAIVRIMKGLQRQFLSRMKGLQRSVHINCGLFWH